MGLRVKSGKSDDLGGGGIHSRSRYTACKAHADVSFNDFRLHSKAAQTKQFAKNAAILGKGCTRGYFLYEWTPDPQDPWVGRGTQQWDAQTMKC